MAIKRDEFPLPDVDDPLTAGFFAGAARGRARDSALRDVRRIGLVSAGPACPHDGGPLTWTPVSGRGTLFTWAVVERAFLPAFADRVPFVTALVVLEEDPALRLCTYLVDAATRRSGCRRAGDGVVPAARVHDGSRTRR